MKIVITKIMITKIMITKIMITKIMITKIMIINLILILINITKTNEKNGVHPEPFSKYDRAVALPPVSNKDNNNVSKEIKEGKNINKPNQLTNKVNSNKVNSKEVSTINNINNININKGKY